MAAERITKEEILQALTIGGRELSNTRRKFQKALSEERNKTIIASKQAVDSICRDLDDYFDSHS